MESPCLFTIELVRAFPQHSKVLDDFKCFVSMFPCCSLTWLPITDRLCSSSFIPLFQKLYICRIVLSMNMNLKMTVERSKRRSYFLSLVFITKRLRFTWCNCWFKEGCSPWIWIASFTLTWKLIEAWSKIWKQFTEHKARQCLEFFTCSEKCRVVSPT